MKGYIGTISRKDKYCSNIWYTKCNGTGIEL